MNAPELFLDFETASHCDLKLHGMARYIEDPSTVPYCLAFQLPGMRTPDLWDRWKPLPRQVLAHIEAGRPVVAHNAGFDFHIWNGPLQRLLPGTVRMDARQVYCSAARARYNGLPGALARAADALGLPVRKDLDGAEFMHQIMGHPEWTPADAPEAFARTFEYAIDDVRTMVALWHATQPLPAREQAFWLLDLEINTRGFGCDVEAAEGVQEMFELASSLIDIELACATDGQLLAASEVQRIRKYATDLGAELEGADRESIRALLEKSDLAPALRAVLELRLDASRAPKKQGAILRAHTRGRMCHATVYHGALSGRSTAMGCGDVQLLNVARPRPGRKTEDTLQYLEAARRRDFDYLSSPEVGPVLAALADAQRHLFCATEPDHVLVCADLSGIEARLTPWCANDEPVLVEFEQGVDGYVVEAAGIFKIPLPEVTKDQRQIGKVVRLSLGFGGGDGALANMAANYGMDLADDLRSRIVWGYREGHPAMAVWWAALEYAVLIALDQPGRCVEVPIGRGFCSRVVFVRDPVALRMELPSGRAISYHNARLTLEPGASAPTAVYDKPEGYVETLDRKILSNNMVQGLARDLFWEGMLDVSRVEKVVHHVYDEMILEVPKDRAELRLAQLNERLSTPPRWAQGLPLASEGFVHLRWQK